MHFHEWDKKYLKEALNGRRKRQGRRGFVADRLTVPRAYGSWSIY